MILSEHPCTTPCGDSERHTCTTALHPFVACGKLYGLGLPFAFLWQMNIRTLLHIDAERVQVHYLEEPCSDYVVTAVETCVELHREGIPGDILIFLTGEPLQRPDSLSV